MKASKRYKIMHVFFISILIFYAYRTYKPRVRLFLPIYRFSSTEIQIASYNKSFLDSFTVVLYSIVHANVLEFADLKVSVICAMKHM